MASRNPVEFNAAVVEEFRARGGYVTGPLADFTLILVHHIGARSGVEITHTAARPPGRTQRALALAETLALDASVARDPRFP